MPESRTDRVPELEAIGRLSFRPERSRPVWRNKHTGKETVVVDLAVNDHGGFQGGCRQHVVVTDEPGPPGPPAPPDCRHRDRGSRGHNVHPLWSFIEHWEPTGEYRDWSEVSKIEAAAIDEYRREANHLRRELETVRQSIARALREEGNAS